jgi:hypothetical protein
MGCYAAYPSRYSGKKTALTLQLSYFCYGVVMKRTRDYMGAVILTVVLGAMLIANAAHEGADRQARLQVLKARVARLEAQNETARASMHKICQESAPDNLFELSQTAGWLTPEECVELSELTAEVNRLEGRDATAALPGSRKRAASPAAK